MSYNIIDSHHHLWKYDSAEYPWITDSALMLCQDFLAEQLKETTIPQNVSGTVLVQARQSKTETDWLLDLAKENREILGVIGWAPLRDELDHLTPALEGWFQNPFLKGFRHVVQDEPEPTFLLDESFNRGIKQLAAFGWTYDLLVFPHQLPSAIEFVDRHPNQKFVLDHLGKPSISTRAFDTSWAKYFRELSKRPHVFCKFSGLATEVHDPTWDMHTLRPYWDCAVDAFGINRLMFGSDWPVCLLGCQYAQWIECVKHLTADLSESENKLFWGSNALDFYGLQIPTT